MTDGPHSERRSLAMYPSMETTLGSDLYADTTKTTDTYKEALPYQNEIHGYKAAGGATAQEQGKGTICGLRRRMFTMVAAIVIVVIIAVAVGGGVGGSLAGKDHKSTAASPIMPESAKSSSSLITDTPTSTTRTPVISTHTTQDASHTLLSDCPSSNNTYYAPDGGPIGQSPTFQKICGSTIRGSNQADGNSVFQSTTTLNQCIDLCAAHNLVNRSMIAVGRQSVCNAVCWRSTIDNNDWPGICFGFATQNSSGSWNLYSGQEQGGRVCDSAGWINQDLGLVK